MHYVALHHWSKFKMNLTTFRWVRSKKPTRKKQPKIVLSAGMKTFEISKLVNCKSDVNETCPRYASPE